MDWESTFFNEIEKTFENDGEAESLMDEIKDLICDLDEFIYCTYDDIDEEVSVFKKMTGNTDNYESIWYEDFESLEEEEEEEEEENEE